MKNIYLTLFALVSLFSFAQETVTQEINTIPPGYYSSATGTGYVLKTQLYDIIKDHTDKGYSGLYTTYLTSDKDYYYENDGTMLDVYTENPTGPECEFTYGINQDDGTLGTNECERYNREHLIPQSVFAAATPMYSDAHFVLPADKHVNGQRGDLPFGKVNVANYTATNGTKRGSNLNSGYSSGYTGVVFEPIDEFKGDIARSLLYFATRYENVVMGFSYPMFNNTSNQVFTETFKNILLTWNILDPVSQREIDRNNAIYARQNNRNPYIDNNSYVAAVWGNPLSNTTFDTISSISVFQNPSNNQVISIQTEAIIDAIQLLTINGQMVQQIIKPNFSNGIYTLTNLTQGFYFLKLTSTNQFIIKKLVVN